LLREEVEGPWRQCTVSLEELENTMRAVIAA